MKEKWDPARVVVFFGGQENQPDLPGLIGWMGGQVEPVSLEQMTGVLVRLSRGFSPEGGFGAWAASGLVTALNGEGIELVVPEGNGYVLAEAGRVVADRVAEVNENMKDQKWIIDALKKRYLP